MWFRRIIAVVLALLLFVIINVSIMAERTISAGTSKNIYVETLRKADAYTFIRTEIPKALLSDLKDLNGSNDVQNILKDIGVSDQEILNTLDRLSLHLRIQEKVENSLENVTDFLTMETDSFEVTIFDPKSLSREVSKETNTLIRDSDLRTLILREVIAANIATIDKKELPLNITITNEEILEISEHVITQKWLYEELEKAVHSIVPYLFGISQTFSVSVKLDDRVDMFSQRLKDILHNKDIDQPILDQISASAIPILIQNQNNIPNKIRFTEDDAKLLISQSLSEQWIEKTIDDLLTQITGYLVGRSESFDIKMEISPIKQDLLFNLERSIKQRTHSYLQNLPRCRENTLTDTNYTYTNKLPECLPGNPVIKSGIESEIVSRVESIMEPIVATVSHSIPNQISFTETDLRLLDSSGIIPRTRNLIINGWTFSDRDLEDFFSERNDRQTYDQILSTRSAIKNSSTFTDKDLRGKNGYPKSSGISNYSDLENIRQLVNKTKTFKTLLFIPVILFAILIAILGGGTWRSRASWGLLAIAVSSAITWIIWTYILPPYIYETVSKVINDEFIRISETELRDFPTTTYILSSHINLIATLIIDSLSNQIASLALYLFSLSTLIILILGTTHIYFNRGRITLQKNTANRESKQSD